MATEEQWRPVAGQPYYEVSNHGRIRSLNREVSSKAGARCLRKGRILRQFLIRGYPRVDMDGRKNVRVHVLVCETFNGPRPSSAHVVAHNDGDQLNNRDVNLRWATMLENNRDMIAHGTARIGSSHPKAKLTEEQVREIRKRAATGESRSAIGRHFGVTTSAIYHVHYRLNWKHVQ